jgi:hypothetical protein
MGVSAAMERRDYLKAQAALLRGVAETFDIKSIKDIKDRVLALADECEQLVTLLDKETKGRLTRSTEVPESLAAERDSARRRGKKKPRR